MTPLSDEALRVLRHLGRPADLAEVTRRMTRTRHASRAHQALRALARQGRVVFNRDGRWQVAASSLKASQS